MSEFSVGANLPWTDYGLDFGANRWQPEGGLARPRRRERLRAALGALAASGAELVRLWVLADGRAGLLEDDAGRIRGLDAHVLGDLDAAADALRASGLRAVLVLTDYLWLARPRWESGVRLGGRQASIRDPGEREALINSVLVPIVARHGHDPTIAAWDVMNEPEWATLGLGTLDPRASVSRRTMRTFLAEAVSALHGCATQPVTVGLARARWRHLVQGLGLDLYQVHWYEALDPFATLARRVETLDLDAPVLLGEYPTRGCTRAPSAVLEAARAAGYCGALAWSARARDRFSDGSACRAALRQWRRRGLRAPESGRA